MRMLRERGTKVIIFEPTLFSDEDMLFDGFPIAMKYLSGHLIVV